MTRATCLLLALAVGCGRAAPSEPEPRTEDRVEPLDGSRPDGGGSEGGPRALDAASVRDGDERRGHASGGEVDFPLHAVALFHQANIYSEPSVRSERLGYVRRGSRLRLGHAIEGRGCREGEWHATSQGGFVCSGRTLQVGESPPTLGFTPTPADLDSATPYEYGMNRVDGVPLYRRIPTPREIRAEEERRQRLLAANRAAAAGPGDGGPTGDGAVAASPEPEEPPDEAPEGAAEEEGEPEEEETPTGPIIRRLQRGFYVTVERTVTEHGRRWVRTAALSYVSADGVSKRQVPDIRGRELGTGFSLPLAIVYADGARTRRSGKGGRPMPGRQLERFDVVPVLATVTLGGETYYATGQGDFVPADRVRRVEAIDPPAEIGADERWIDVDLAEQTLVAYEGARPVYAALVATGKPGFETPPGSYRITSKHVSTSMSDDPDGDEPYLIEDVPWTLYFEGALAIHGAFWHSRFGRVRSHGCVNLAPADARWIFFWANPRIPEGWHGVTSTEDNPGSRVYIRG